MALTEGQAAEIEAQRGAWRRTRRATVDAMEERMYGAVAVLDHGFVRVVDYMGDDAAVVQAARVSYGAGTRKVSEDAGLIGYLMRRRHSTPFEMPCLRLHVKAPIFVARQWIRHRMSSTNEISGRYSILDGEFYVPEPEHLAAQGTANRQGRGEVLGEAEAADVLRILREDSALTYAHYERMLNERPDGTRVDPDRKGLARELARMNLTVAAYTQWYWRIDLHNLLSFLSLRADAHAQHEIRAYAEVILGVVADWVPMAHAAFLEHRTGAATLSAGMVAALRRIVAGEDVGQSESGLSGRDWRDLMGVMGR